MKRTRKDKANKPKNTVETTIFFKGKLLQGFRDNAGFVYADDGNVYQFDKVAGQWASLTAGKTNTVAVQKPTQSIPAVELGRSHLGEIVVMDDGSAYQYQDVDGSVKLVCIMKHAPAFVSLSYVRGSIHGKISGRSPSR